MHVSPRDRRLEGLQSDRLVLDEGGKGSQAYAHRFGASVAEALSVLRKVNWRGLTKPMVDAWLDKYPTDVVHRQAVEALIGRAHRDANLENFLCEAKRHAEVFNGGGKSRMYRSPNEADKVLADRVSAGPLG